MSRKLIVALIGWIALSNLAGLIGALATTRAGDFYRTLERPPWAPPSWLFGPVWTALFVMMGVAAWMVWKSPGDGETAAWRRRALWLFLVQLVANTAWSWIFFAWRLGALAFVEIIVLAGLIIMTIIAFGRVSRAAAWLLVPYLAWVLFAAMLTFAIWQRNPGTL